MGGQMLSAAFNFLGELLPAPPDSPALKEKTTVLAATLKQSLSQLMEQDEHGRLRLTFALPTPQPLTA
jgi:hypothetical protein